MHDTPYIANTFGWDWATTGQGTVWEVALRQHVRSTANGISFTWSSWGFRDRTLSADRENAPGNMPPRSSSSANVEPGRPPDLYCGT